jgi:hypothetical protein
MFAKSTIASAVAAALGVSAVGVAQANTSVFFPYVALSDTVTTIVSVINKSNANYFANGNPPYRDANGNWVDGKHLHYRFFFKSASDNNAACGEYNEYLATSQFDIQTIDLGGVFGTETLGVLFEDPSTSSYRNQWYQEGKSYAMGEVARAEGPAVGYLYVDNFEPAGVRDTLGGEAMVFEFGSGASWGYQAYSSPSADFTWAASASPQDIALMPASVSTRLFVTPVSVNQAPDGSNSYGAVVDIVTNGNLANIFDRDENLISGTRSVPVTCVGRINVYEQMLSSPARDRLTNGGWAGIVNYRTANGAAALSNRNFPWVVQPGDIVPGAAVAAAYQEASSDAESIYTGQQYVCDYVYENNEVYTDYQPVVVRNNGNVSCPSIDDGSMVAGNVSAAMVPGVKRIVNVGALPRQGITGGAVVMKLEFATDAFDGDIIGGTFNNGFVLQPMSIAPIQ